MTALLYLLGVAIFVLAIAVSIGLHELGHLVPAKRFGRKVTQYFIGFGPTLWSFRRGETEYGVKAIPLGGYVKIVGMLPPGQEGELRSTNTGMFTQLISDSRKAEMELVGPNDGDRLFYQMPWWKKVVVMAGGPTVNLAIAFVIFAGLFALHGIPHVDAAPGRPVVAHVSECVIPFTEEGRECGPSDPIAPANEAGLRPGDVITSFNGTEVSDWDQLRTMIRDNADGTAVIGYERDGQQLSGTTSTTVEARPASDTDESLVQVGFLGVSPTTYTWYEKGGLLFTLEQMWGMTKETVVALAHLPVKVWDVAQAIVGLEERKADSPVSIVGGGRIAGEATAHEEIATTEKAVFLLQLIAGFNFFIGMFNFLPLLPLDGGHIASALWEALRRGFARLRGRPDPGYVDAAKLLPVAYVVAVCFLVMGVVLIIGDLVVPIHLTST